MGMNGLPDMYTQSLRACDPWALQLGVLIRQTTHAHGITITCVILSYKLCVLITLNYVYGQIKKN